jgi:hypothetical protein
VQATAFDELAMFRAIASSGVRALLIGRQALVALGMPVMTSEDVWERRASIEIGDGVCAVIPCIDDLILTMRFGARPRDADDIRWLEELKRRA